MSRRCLQGLQPKLEIMLINNVPVPIVPDNWKQNIFRNLNSKQVPVYFDNKDFLKKFYSKIKINQL